MTQRQGSQEKKQKILAAASEILAQKGFAAATVSQVAARAGVSRGLLHYYFTNKEELLTQVVRSNMETVLELTAAMFAKSRTAGELAARMADALRQVVLQRPEFFALLMELFALAHQRPAVAVELKAFYRTFRGDIRQRLQEARDRGYLAPSIDLDGLAPVLTGLLDGLGLQMAADSDLARDSAAWEAVETTFRRLLADI